MTRTEVDHLQTQPLSPASQPRACLAVVPAQRSAQPPTRETCRLPELPELSGLSQLSELPESPELLEPSGPPALPVPVARSRAMFVTASALTACALLSSVWGAVATSRSPVTPVTRPAASGPVAASPEHGPSPAAARPGVPVPAPGQIGGDGIFLVGPDIQPGTYRTAGPSPWAFDNCYWERSRDTSGEQRAAIAKGLVPGPVTVTIKRTDGAFKSSGCENWTRVR